MEKIYKFEKYFFLLIIVLNIEPIFETTFFPTLDGPAHSYNANLIKEFWFGNPDFLSTYFSLNPDFVPNWIGHFVLVFFKTFLPAAYAEKGLLLIYFIGLPFAFRSLIQTISPNNKQVSYLIFPFLYSSVFAMGFYNFSLALIFLFLTLTVWFKNQDDLGNIKTRVTLFLLITITYFSHLFVFVLVLFLIGLNIFWNGIQDLQRKEIDNKTAFQKGLQKAGKLIVVSFVPLVLLLIYFLNRTPSGNNDYLTTNELWEALKNGDSIIAYNRYEEQAFTRKIFYLFSGLSVFALGQWIYSRFVQKKKLNYSSSIFWGITAVTVLIMYFNLPDSDETAGYVSSRLGLLFFLFAAIWLGTQNLNKIVLTCSIAAILFFNYKLINYHKSQTKILDEVAMECYQASRFVEPNKVVLPIDNSNHWLLSHYSNYLGVDKPLVILENYEAFTGYFPINWNDNDFPNIYLGLKNGKNYPCLYWKSREKGEQKKADYVFVLGNEENKKDSCQMQIASALNESYTLVFYSKNTKLYTSK